MNVEQGPRPRRRRYSARYQARFDVETYAKLQELARILCRKHGQVVRHVMQWGLRHAKAWTVEPSIPASAHLVHILVEPAVMPQVQAAADRQQVKVATWVQHAMRQVSHEDFPASWRGEETAVRSHESGSYHRKFQARLDGGTSRK